MIRRLIFFLIRATGVPLLLRELIQRRRVSILCYHDPQPEDFERQIRALRRRYNFISLRHYLDCRRDPSLRLPAKALVLTFDDGHRNNYRLRDIIERYALPTTIFLCSSIVGTQRHYWWKRAEIGEREQLKRLTHDERLAVLARRQFEETREYAQRQSLSDSEIEALKSLVDFQSHTRFHPILPSCTNERAADEIRGSKTELEHNLGLPIYAFAYPNGDYSERDRQLVRAAGYECALTIAGGYNDDVTDRYRLRRIRMSDRACANEAIVKASGLWSVWEWLQRVQRFFRPGGQPTINDGDGNVAVS